MGRVWWNPVLWSKDEGRLEGTVGLADPRVGVVQSGVARGWHC